MINHLVNELGLNPNDYFCGKSYVGHAAGEGNVGVTRTLLRLGVDVNLEDTIGRTPLIFCTSAAPLSKVYATMKVLLEHGADETRKDREGYTAKEMLQEDYVNNSRYDNVDYTPAARTRYASKARALLERVDRWRFKQVFSVVSRAFLDVRRKGDQVRRTKTKSRTKSRTKKMLRTTNSTTTSRTFLEVNSDVLFEVYAFL